MEIKEHHLINSYEFENLLADLFNLEEAHSGYYVFGRRGQKQSGIDVYSNQSKTAIQCKYKDKAQNVLAIKKEIETEVRKAMDSQLEIRHYIFATTSPHDKDLQIFSAELSENIPFPISFLGWEEIRKKVIKYPNILNHYFGGSSNRIEFVSLSVDEENCSWQEKGENTFFKIKNSKPKFPIFDFSFINNSNDTIILKKLHLNVESLPSGISGLPESGILNPLAKFSLVLDPQKNTNTLNLNIFAKPKVPFRFQVEVSRHNFNYQEYETFKDRYILSFKFEFNNNVIVKAPKVLLNTHSEETVSKIIIHE